MSYTICYALSGTEMGGTAHRKRLPTLKVCAPVYAASDVIYGDGAAVHGDAFAVYSEDGDLWRQRCYLWQQ